MRNITTALLMGAYLCLALTVSALVWRGGAGWGAATAALVGALGFAFALHVLIAQAATRRALVAEIEAIREAHRLLADALEQTQTDLADISARIDDDAALKSTEALTSEVRVLEDLVQRMAETMDDRLLGLRMRSIEAPNTELGRRSHRAAAMLETVREALSENRVDLYLQPVVGLPQRKTVFYEAFSRLRDETGRVIMPAEYLPVAEPEGLAPAIDNLLLFRCAQIVRRLAKQDRRVAIFCNISAASLGDEAFFPHFLEFLADNRDMAGAIVFELGQAAFEARSATEARNMSKLADLGFRFSLDHVQSLDIDFQDLQRSDVAFLKVSAELLLEQLLDVEGLPALKGHKDIHAADFAQLTRRRGLEVIAEKVETERQVVDVLELEIGYGQGHLFGEPRAIKEQVLAETDPPADYIKNALRGGERRRRRLG
jgi:cyclic-di-GMP phosphodiesterase TipF (flagellum assembly factor)